MMVDGDPDLRLWGWFFLALYIGAMLAFGYIGMRRVRSSDDFATARAGYGPLFLAFALTATAASGGTFIGIPAIAYKSGVSALWYAFVYPLGCYFGLAVCLRGIRRAGRNFGTRSMPEYLGDRFDSEALRVCVALFSMLLMFYLAGQLLSGAIMFNKMMGIALLPALIVTAVIVMIYIVIGGAHADILTDGVQGALMLLLSLAVVVMFFTGFGVDGGLAGLFANLEAQDPGLVAVLSPTNPILDSWWDVFAIFILHVPLGLLPHVGNKLWALKNDRDQLRFIVISFAFGMLLPAIALGGLLARGVLGGELLVDGASPNDAIPALFIETLPAWLDRATPRRETVERNDRQGVAENQPHRLRADRRRVDLARVDVADDECRDPDRGRGRRHGGRDGGADIHRDRLARHDEGRSAGGILHRCERVYRDEVRVHRG